MSNTRRKYFTLLSSEIWFPLGEYPPPAIRMRRPPGFSGFSGKPVFSSFVSTFLDGAFFSRILHHAEDYKALLKEAMRCVKKTGWLAVIELHKKEMEGAHPVDELLDEAEVRAAAEKQGFMFSRRHDVNERYYVLVMRK